jgi:hypothetical protein
MVVAGDAANAAECRGTYSSAIIQSMINTGTLWHGFRVMTTSDPLLLIRSWKEQQQRREVITRPYCSPVLQYRYLDWTRWHVGRDVKDRDQRYVTL